MVGQISKESTKCIKDRLVIDKPPFKITMQKKCSSQALEVGRLTVTGVGEVINYTNKQHHNEAINITRYACHRLFSKVCILLGQPLFPIGPT